MIQKDSINNATMGSHPHIKLLVDSQLDPNIAKLWLRTASDNLPDGLPANAEISVDGKPKNSSFYHVRDGKQHAYIIPLSRDPNVAEVQKVADAWDAAAPKGDFEIDYSSAGAAAEIKRDVEDVGLREIAMEAAKLNHNSWLTEMSNQGWSYGQRFDQRSKRTPMLMPWDQLSNKYQLQELRRFHKLMEVLQGMRLHLVRK